MLELPVMEPPRSGQGKFRAGSLRLSSLNHISRTCADLRTATNFYEQLLGFVQIRRPGSLDVDGSWLYNYGIGIHLLQSDDQSIEARKKSEINPKSEHISFQCEDIHAVEMQLKENRVPYLRERVEDGGIWVDQLFFHDPDGFMIEVCNCDALPMVPLSCAKLPNLCANRQPQKTLKMFGNTTSLESTKSRDMSGAIPIKMFGSTNRLEGTKSQDLSGAMVSITVGLVTK